MGFDWSSVPYTVQTNPIEAPIDFLGGIDFGIPLVNGVSNTTCLDAFPSFVSGN